VNSICWTKTKPGTPASYLWIERIFKKILNAEGTVCRYKARLVCKSLVSKEGVDFPETFRPVAKFVSIRLHMVIVAFYNLNLFYMDVITAFLNPEVKSDI
jgi:hypothetical protein